MTTIKFPELKETEGRLSAKRKELAELYVAAKNDQGELDASKIKGFANGSELAEHVRAINAEIDDLSVKASDQREIARGAELALRDDESDAIEGDGDDVDARKGHKSFGDAFIAANAHQIKGREIDLDVELKTLMTTSAGWAADVVRGPRLVLDEQRPLQVADIVPTRPTSQTAITYMEETTFTNNAAEVAEGGTKPEAALALTEQTSTVRKIAVWLPVTDEQLEDVEGIRAYLNNRLPFMVRQRLDLQIISGNGTAPNLEGVENVTGVQTQAKGSDPTPDAVYKAITKVEVTGQAMPDGVVFHPNDWQEVRLLRTADGIYIWGNPSEAGPARIWGLPVVKAQAATEGTAIVGDWGNFSELAVKKGVTVETSNSHDTYFVENKQAVRAEMRAAFTVYRPTAFCLVTGV